MMPAIAEGKTSAASSSAEAIARTAPIAFYTVANAGYFPGLVGLLNSLRLMGHSDPVIVADCGLTAAQRALLAPHCTLYRMPDGVVRNPCQYKPFPHLLAPQGTVVVIDSDMIVTAPLDPVIAAAASGKVCLFPDVPQDRGRWFAEWRDIFALAAAPRRQIYGCSGLVAFSARHWPHLLERWWQACAAIFAHPTVQEGGIGPTQQGDQDALNAILMSEVPADAIGFLPAEQQVFRWEFRKVRLLDAATLACRFRGGRPAILHATLLPKPWQRDGFRRSVYVTLLRRLLTAGDVALALAPEQLAIWLRREEWSGLAGAALSLRNATRPKRAVSLARRLRKRWSKWRAHRASAPARQRQEQS